MRLIEQKFRDWLKAKPPSEIVGNSRDCHACPLASFYHDASGGCEVVISDSGDGYRIDRGYSDRPLPYWAHNFVHNIDGENAGLVTAAFALEILARARA